MRTGDFHRLTANLQFSNPQNKFIHMAPLDFPNVIRLSGSNSDTVKSFSGGLRRSKIHPLFTAAYFTMKT